MSECACPAPDVSLETIPSGPIRCSCCGHPLELTCAGQCDPVHHRAAIEAAAPRTIAQRSKPPRRSGSLSALGAVSRGVHVHDPDRRATGTNQARIYRSKPCKNCTLEFQPTGPRAEYCDHCKGSPVV